MVTNGHNVRVLDNLPPQIHGSDPMTSLLFLSIRSKVEFSCASVTTRADLMKVLPGMDTVVHLAEETAKNCVIGTNSVVTTDIPDWSIVVGSPARIFKRYDFSTQSWMKVQQS